MAATLERHNKSVVWSFFTKKNDFTAICNTCGKDYSFKTSLSNLRKHWYKKHGKPEDFTDASNTEMDSSDGEINGSEMESSSTKKKLHSTWQYFEVNDSEKFEATCKLCEENIAYDTVADLTKHVRAHGEMTKESDDDDQRQEVQEGKQTNRRSSKVWKHFTITNEAEHLAKCHHCRRTLTYAGTVTNLRRHLARKHSEIPFEEKPAKKMIVMDGQMYEVASPSKLEIDDNDKDPIAMNEIYLEDEDDLIEQLNSHEARRNIPKPAPKPESKRTFKTKLPKEHYRNRNRNRNRDSSSEDEQPNKKRKITKNMDSLEYFGQYVISLLKKLPETASDQLQSEIIKQILTTKTALELQATKKYAITISDIHSSNLNQSNQIITEPVTVTISESQGSIGTGNDNIMIVENTDNKNSV